MNDYILPPKNVFTDRILPPGKVLVLKACRSGRRSNWNPRFQYPPPGEIVSVANYDWDPRPKCGEGLHGWLWGTGSVRSAGSDWAFRVNDVTWLVLEVDADRIIDLEGKVKFPSAKVIFEGSVKDCTDLIARFAPPDSAIIGRHATAGLRRTATVGDYGTAVVGDYDTSTAGDFGISTAGMYGTALAGYQGISTAGDYGSATACDYGTATAGNYGTSNAGDFGTSVVGGCGTATAGDRGTSIAGDFGIAKAGSQGIATAGEHGTIMIKYWNAMFSHYRWAIGEVGIDGIEPNTPYYVVCNGKLVKKVG